jgi:2-polyprenyl-6-methoxyphenol hydroxylase-like FAD-dependent oxidoreductase
MTPIKRALIIGSGIGGLCAAIGLRQVGIEAIVYEQAERLDPIGAGLTLWANAIKALRKLGLADAAVAAGSKIELGELRAAGGRTLSRSAPGEFERFFGEPTIGIHRADLHTILCRALPSDLLHLGARCVGFVQDGATVNVHFANGTRDQADLLIGADGIHSIIREQLFPEVKLRYAGYTAWRGVVATADKAALGLTTETWGHGARFGFLRIDEERVYWFATHNTAPGNKQSGAESKAFLRQRFKGWHHPISLLVESTPEEQILQTDIYDIEPMKEWGKGAVILLGDAAHPTTPNLGQGACMAIESSVVLARCLSQELALDRALNRYQLERMPRTAWITRQSWKIGRLGQLENAFACGLRDLAIRLVPDKWTRQALETAVAYGL